MTRNCLEFLILFIIFLVIGQSSCANPKVAKPQRGGSAQVSLAPSAPSMTITQPENSQTPTLAKYERKVIPVGTINSNWGIVLQEKYETELGTHQTDEARAGFAAVQKTAAVLKAQSPIMYVGLVLIVCALAMSYFQAKFPAVFAPGLKVIALTFLTGLCLAVLPALVHNKTFLIFSLLAGIGIVFGYIYSKQFSTGKNTEEKKENNL